MRNTYLVLFIYLMIPMFSLAENTYTTQQREDSLLSLLKSSPTVDEQIKLYKDLATMYRQTPKEIVYLNKMADVASSTLKGHASLYYAWANLSRHYYNIQNRDSLIYWSHKIDSLAAAKNEVPDALFDARGFICQMDLWDGNYELAMNGAISLYNYARDTKSEYGLICCNENLGLIYQEIHRDSDAIVAYREGLDLLQKRGDNPKFEMQYMGNLIESYLRTDHFTEAKELLTRYDEMIQDRERENEEQGTAFPVDRCRALMYVFYADMYVLQDKPKETLDALLKATPIVEKTGDDYTEFCYNFVFAKYYYLIGMYERALNIIDKNKLTEAIEYMDKAFKNYDAYSQKEEPRISHEEVRMGKIELLMQDNQNKKALNEINKYEKKFGQNKKEIFYKGQLLEKTGEYEKALEYLDKSLDEDHTIIALNSKGNALYELGEYKKALDSYNSCITHEKDVKDDLELVTNFNYKAAFCNVELGNYDEAVKHLNKTIDMLNENGRLDKNLEEIYQKCSFEKDRLMYKNNVEDKRFSNFKFLSTKTSITALIIIIIAYIILKIIGY